MRRRWMITSVAAVGLVAAGCTKGGGAAKRPGQEEAAGTITVAGQLANDHGTADASGSATIDVEQDDFYFSPTVLSGSAGESLTVELKNEGKASHTFTIDALGVDVEVQPGATAQAQVTFPSSGALLYYCRFHAGQGMRGGLSVGGDLEPAAGSGDGTGGSGYGYG